MDLPFLYNLILSQKKQRKVSILILMDLPFLSQYKPRRIDKHRYKGVEDV